VSQQTCKFYVESPLPCASGVGGTGLKQRIVRIMTQPPGTPLGRAREMLLAAAALIALAGPVGFGLLFAMQTSAQLLHATSTPLPAFEVATIKPSKEERPGTFIRMSPANFSTKHSSLKDLIKYAYYIKSDDQLAGGPSWMNTEFFDVQAKAQDSEIKAINKLNWEQEIEQTRLMVQSLLADRFQLKASIQTREREVYALVVAKGGPKLKEVEVSPFPPPGTLPAPGAHLPSIGTTGQNRITASAWPMNLMADWLSNFPEMGNHVVVDETGLRGNYDFVLNGVSLAPPQLPSASAAPPEGDSATSIFTALQEQLGLKLESRKAKVEVLIIDHAEKPSPN
jgi:bla regulator protein BlaR1